MGGGLKMKRWVIVFGVLSIFCFGIGRAANRVYIRNSLGDTIWSCSPFGLRIGIENDVTWKGMSLGFKIYSPDGGTWSWISDPSGYGAHKYVRVMSGTRMYPPEAVWDAAFSIWEEDVDGNSPNDQILITGTANSGGLTSGPAQEMFEFDLIMVPYSHTAYTICIDSMKVNTFGDWIFTDEQDNSHVPEISWAQGGACWPVKPCPCHSPSIVDIGPLDAFHCSPGSATVTANGFGDEVHWDYELVSGQGTILLANSVGDTNTITYTPAPDETSGTASVIVKVGSLYFPPKYNCFNNQWVTMPIDIHMIGDANNDNTINVGDAVYLINYIFKGGTAPHALKAGDANCDGNINVGDAVRVINYVFKGGPSPVSACCQ